MIKAQLNNPNGTELISFDIPTALSEVPLSRFINFLVESRAMDDAENSLTVMTRCVSIFLDIDLSTLLSSAAGVLNAGSESYSGSISQIYGHIVKMIADYRPRLYQPESAIFEFNGHQYFIPTIIQQAIIGEYILPDLTVSEVVEVIEIARFKEQTTKHRGDEKGDLRRKIDKVILDKIKEDGLDPDGEISKAGEQVYQSELERLGDPDGSLLFTYYLHTLAILCRRSGETLPFEDSARESWIQTRAIELQDIDAETALNVDFFLTNISVSYERKPPVVGSLSHLCFAVVAEMQLRSAKRGKGLSINPKKRLKKWAGVR